jgi:hypothetical protein
MPILPDKEKDVPAETTVNESGISIIKGLKIEASLDIRYVWFGFKEAKALNKDSLLYDMNPVLLLFVV